MRGVEESGIQAHALILHGTDGHPGENWFPWARRELRERGFAVDVPALPTPEGHSLENWTTAFLVQTTTRSYDICLTHSLGTAFALRLVESSIIRVRTLISVAGCIGSTGIARFDKLNHSFLADQFQWRQIGEAIRNSVVVYSDNDPYIDLAQSRQLSSELHAKTIVLDGAGHINTAAGFTQLHAVEEVFDGIRTSVIG